MGYASSPRALALVQLCVVVVSCFFCFTVFGEEIQALPPNPHHYYPVEAPSHPPSHPPSHHHHHHHPHPPTASPVHPPTTHPHVPVPSPSHHHHHHHHIHPPSPAPVHPPSHTPLHPPSHTPLHPPTHTPVQPPSHPPTHNTPTHPPAHPPTQPPSHPPTHKPAPSLPPRKFVAVQGVVYCKKTCNYAGKHTLLGASPLLGGTVRLYCKNTKYSLKLEAKTDKNGYFFIAAPDSITSYGAHKCTVSLGSSPLASCQKPSELHGGFKGSFLRPEKPIFYLKRPYLLYSVGPFVFEPKC